MLFVFMLACSGTKESAIESTPTESGTDSEPTESTPTEVSFSGDVWPILEANCQSCHASDEYSPGFKLDNASNGYTALTTDIPNDSSVFTAYVVPNNPDASLLVDKIEKSTPDYGGAQMPLDGAYQPAPLSSDDQGTIRAWIEAGAPNN